MFCKKDALPAGRTWSLREKAGVHGPSPLGVTAMASTNGRLVSVAAIEPFSLGPDRAELGWSEMVRTFEREKNIVQEAKKGW